MAVTTPPQVLLAFPLTITSSGNWSTSGAVKSIDRTAGVMQCESKKRCSTHIDSGRTKSLCEGGCNNRRRRRSWRRLGRWGWCGTWNWTRCWCGTWSWTRCWRRTWRRSRSWRWRRRWTWRRSRTRCWSWARRWTRCWRRARGRRWSWTRRRRSNRQSGNCWSGVVAFIGL